MSSVSAVRQPRPSHATTWITLTMLVVASGGMFIYAGDALHRLLGTSSYPQTEGADPVRPGRPTSDVPHAVPSDGGHGSQVALAPSSPATATVSLAPLAAAAGFADQAQGERLLGRAEKSLRGLDWAGAHESASRLQGLAVDSVTRTRAQEILQHSALIEQLFRQLAEHAELTRACDTDPSLLAVGDGPHPMLIVPLDAVGQVVQVDPVGYVLRQSQSYGVVNALIQGKSDFIKGQLTGPLTSVHLVDQVQVRARMQRELQHRIRTLDQQPEAAIGTAWYAVAKFAYRNRLDEQVPALMERAIALDPQLLSSVREMLAGQLLARMVFHLKSHNQMAADADLTQIRKHYADTDHGRQAACYYAGDTHGYIALAAQQSAQGPAAATHGTLAQPAAPLPAGEGGAATAAERFDAGMIPYGKAIDLGLCDERNRLLQAAQGLFAQSASLYAALCAQHPDDEDLQLKMVNARFFMEACIHDETVP